MSVKRPRSPSHGAKRLFGTMLHGTLASAKMSAEHDNKSEAAARRAAIDERLRGKLEEERKAMLEHERTKEVEGKVRMVQDKGQRRRTAVETAKDRLATHLEVWARVRKEVDPPLPIGVIEAREGEDYLFWLPYKLTPEQKEQVERQSREVETWLQQDRQREAKAVELIRARALEDRPVV